MNSAFDNLRTAKKAVDATRVLGHDCRGIILQQGADSNIVRIAHGDCFLFWYSKTTRYLGQPTRALKAIGAELYHATSLSNHPES